MAGSPAETCQQLYVNDELLAVNHQDVSQMHFSDIVPLIVNSGVSVHLTVRDPDPEGERQACTKYWRSSLLVQEIWSGHEKEMLIVG